MEKLRERDIDKTTLSALMCPVIAAMIMNITYTARIRPGKPCTVFFGEDEWKLLYRAANKTKKEMKKNYTIQEAVTYLAWLGGPKRAPCDGPPVVKTVWMGLNTRNTLLTYRELLV